LSEPDAGRLGLAPPIQDRAQGLQWRAERNFWICLFGFSLWVILVRVEAILRFFWKKIDAEEKHRPQAVRSPTEGNGAKKTVEGSLTGGASSVNPSTMEMVEKMPRQRESETTRRREERSRRVVETPMDEVT